MKQLKELRLGDILLESGYITAYQLEVALEEQKKAGVTLGQQLVQLDFITREERLEAVADQLGMEYVVLEDVQIPPEIVGKLEYGVCAQYHVMPVEEKDGVLHVAMAHPQNVENLDAISFVAGQQVRGLVADEGAIAAAHEKYYGSAMAHLDEMLEKMDMGDMEVVEEFEETADIAKAADSRPVVNLLNQILKIAIKDAASDIHFEPYEDSFRIRYRVDGVLYEIQSPPKSMAPALIARIKIISKLNISEVRLPQDGRIALKVEGRNVDLRVSTVPTKFGESAVLRILDRSVVSLDLHNLRMSEEEMSAFQRIINKPNGIVLVTGPTGAGKTTTLYACLNEINKIDMKIITNEDPIEYNIDGLVQVPINPEVGMTYANSLRATLRQDPDVILIGEIRDKETADIAVESSLTGHLVFSTLHTNDAPSTITRLTDMGVETFLITATLEAVVSQRLVRTICPKCKTNYTPVEEQLMPLGLDPTQLGGSVTFYRGMGCENCRGTGYRGRVALYEILHMVPTVRDLILSEASTQELYQAAVDSGMKTLRQVGIQKIFDGLTTIEEVMNATIQED